MEPNAPLSWEDLPPEVLEIVFSKIGCGIMLQSQLGPLRLVNSSWRNTIDHSLKSLDIFKKRDIEALGRTFPRLERMLINFEDEEIFHKASSIKSLTNLSLWWDGFGRSKVIPNGVELLTNLSTIFLANDELTPKFIEAVCTLSRLKSLSLCSDVLMKDRSLGQLSVMTNLTMLELGPFRLASVEILSGLTNLEVLRLEGSDRARYVCELDVNPLSSLVNLTRLHVKRYWIDAFDNVLAEFKNLTWLEICNNFIDDHNVATLRGLSKLTHLDLSCNRVTDEGFRSLTGLASLKKLFLDETRVENSIQLLAPLTGLEVLHLDSTPTKLTDLAELSNLVGLKEVSVRHSICKMDRSDTRDELERALAAHPHIKFEIDRF